MIYKKLLEILKESKINENQLKIHHIKKEDLVEEKYIQLK